MADSDQQRERELVLAPNEFAYILDRTKGHIDVYCGPHKSSLANTDSPVVFDERLKRFRKVELTEAIQTNKIAPEGWYLILKNPSKDDTHPKSAQRQGMPELNAGQKVNIHGPCGFALWPGQMARVLQGHHIRSNQYLLVRVYDEKAAKDNWSKSVIKGAEGEDAQRLLESMPDLTMGKCMVIKGTEASFYIPPTGIEVVPDSEGETQKLVRDAVTLERLEYCLLLDENGNKRYERGPAVVFPSPTEVFRTQEKKDAEGTPTGEKTRKFRAIELSQQAGIHVKVIADYTDETGAHHKAGDELFITGKQTAIYFPREEHAVIKYGDQEVHYATAVPEGEARYVLHRHTGQVRLVKGPTMLLPDPREEVLTRRVLDTKTCELLYPGNTEALGYNQRLQESLVPTIPSEGGTGPVGVAMALQAASYNASFGEAAYGRGLIGSAAVSDDAAARGLRGRAGRNFTGDVLQRKNQYTEPRTITLNTKYQGAVTTSIWTNYAMLLVRKSGQRRVVQGPATVMLEYDETPQVLSMSTGKPKTTDKLYNTVFLNTRANKVVDVIEADTKDFVKVSVKVSYRVNFEGDDPEKWFQVENYVKFLCDHLRSRVRGAVRKLTVEQFFTDSEEMLRDVILGSKPEGGKRDGLLFVENNMRVYDAEILTVSVLDKDVERRLIDSQRETINYHLNLVNARRGLEYTRETEDINRQKAQAKLETTHLEYAVRSQELKLKTEHELSALAATAKMQDERFTVQKAEEEAKNALNQLVLARSRESVEQQLRFDNAAMDLRLREIRSEVEAVVEKAKAVSPDLISALDTFGERVTVQKAVEAMAPLSILSGGKKSVIDIVGELLKGTPLAKQLPTVTSSANGNGNGRQEHQASA